MPTVEFPEIESIENKRYFLVCYNAKSPTTEVWRWEFVCSTTNWFINRSAAISEIEKAFTFHPVRIGITSIFEFQSKRDFEDYTWKEAI